MSRKSKGGNPIDRSVRDLDRQIAALERQVQQVQQAPAAPPSPAAPARRAPSSAASSSIGDFLRSMMAPPRRLSAPTYRARADLFDVGNETMRDLEAEPVSLGRQPELFPSAAGQPVRAFGRGVAPAPGGADGPAAKDDLRLMQYLSASSLRSYPRLRHEQRRLRNRFFGWLGPALLACFAIYIVFG